MQSSQINRLFRCYNERPPVTNLLAMQRVGAALGGIITVNNSITKIGYNLSRFGYFCFLRPTDLYIIKKDRNI